MFCTKHSRPLLRVSDEAKEYLVLYNWPGNIRELRNEIERLCGMLEVNDVVRPKHLAAAIIRARKERREAAVEAGPNEVLINVDQPLASAYAEIDRHAIVAALKKDAGNLEAASKRLGVTRKGLYNKRLRFGMLCSGGPTSGARPVCRRGALLTCIAQPARTARPDSPRARSALEGA